MLEDKDIAILVIDDDAMVLEVLEEYLVSYGFTNITCVSDSLRANSLIRNPSRKWDLIISDWEMPNLTGLTLLKAVRSLASTQNTKFIIVTSQQSMERYKITQAAYSQVNAYIVKPFRSDILKDKIWKAMGWSEEDSGDVVEELTEESDGNFTPEEIELIEGAADDAEEKEACATNEDGEDEKAS